MLEHKATALNFLYLPLTVMLSSMDTNQLMILGWLIIIDFITGISKSIVLKIAITKNRAIEGVIFKSITLLIPLVVALVAKGLGLDIKEYVFWIISILIVAEGYGIFGNILSIRNKKEVEEQDVINILLHNLRKILEKFMIENKKDFKD